MKVIMVDNYDRELYADKLKSDVGLSKEDAQAIASELNKSCSHNWHHLVVEDDHKLFGGPESGEEEECGQCGGCNAGDACWSPTDAEQSKVAK